MLGRRAAAAFLVIALLATAGCGSKKSNPVQPPPPDTPPNPNTAVNAVLLLEWAVEHRDTTQYRTLFTSDYGFGFVPGDTASTNNFAGSWGYAQERASAAHLFVTGSPGRAPAAHITLTATASASLIDQADPRPGKNPTWHRMVAPGVFAPNVTMTDSSAEQITGSAVFYLVRGDSANLPVDLAAAGVTATSSRWFIEGWSDKTGGVSPQTAIRPARAQAVELPTWGRLKVHYLPPF